MLSHVKLLDVADVEAEGIRRRTQIDTGALRTTNFNGVFSSTPASLLKILQVRLL